MPTEVTPPSSKVTATGVEKVAAGDTVVVSVDVGVRVTTVTL